MWEIQTQPQEKPMEQPEHSGPGCWEGLIHHRGPERGYRRERDGSSPQAWPSPPGESREAGTSCPTGTGQLEAPTLELSLGKFNVTEPRVNW